jgi:hypothetical protein
MTWVKIHKCSLCEGDIEQKQILETGEVYWSSGNNAAPLSEGRCCDTCNREKVIPARMRDIADTCGPHAEVLKEKGDE